MDAPLLTVAARSLATAVADAAAADQLDRVLPGGGDAPTVRDAAQSAAFDLAWVPDVLAGRTEDDASPAQRGDDLLGAEPGAALSGLAEAAVAAVAGHDDPQSTAHLSYGDFPAHEYLEHVTTYYGLLAVDLAAVTGTLPPSDLVDGLWALLEPQADGWREMGVFGPRVPVADGAPLLDRLRGLTGRQP